MEYLQLFILGWLIWSFWGWRKNVTFRATRVIIRQTGGWTKDGKF